MSTFRSMLRPRLAAVAVLLPLLAGCGVLSGPPQRALFRTTPVFGFPTGLPRVSAQLLIAAPAAPAGLDTRRIALSRSPVSLDYFADAEWTDRVPFLVQDALVEGFQKSGSLAAVGADRSGLRADFVLDAAVDDFTAIYDSPDGVPRARVSLNLKLVKMPERNIVAHTTVMREQPAAANTLPDIVRAFDGAVGGAVQDAVIWTVGNPALSGRARSVR